MTVILSTSFRHNRNNRWSGVSENTHLYVWQNQGTLHLTKITSLRNHSRHANHIHKTKCCTSNPAPDPPLPMTATHLIQSFHEPSGKHSPIIPFFKRNQEKPNKKFKSWFRHPPQVWFYEDKKKIPPLQRNCVICRSFFMYVQWLGKNYCICEGTCLWFKA